MKSALAYRSGRSPLHRASPGVAIAFLGSLALIAFVCSSPLVLAADGLAVAIVGVAAGARRAVAAALRLALPLLVLMTVVNGLVVHRGETILLRGWDLPVIGSTDITLEALAAGASIGMRVVVAILAFAVYSACVDPDRVLRALRPLAGGSALTTALVMRMVPVVAADAARAREASELRGPAAAQVGRPELLRRLVEGSLDRAVDVAATLELRGHALGVRAIPRPQPRAPGVTARFVLASAAIAGLAVAALLSGAGSFDTYPTIEVDLSAATLALCAALPLLAAAPFTPTPAPPLRVRGRPGGRR
jgi:energy-coupling factor transport system permease protein